MFRALLRWARKRPATALLDCPQCHADALCPIAWETSGDDHWLMWMRCGACGEWLESFVDNPTAAALDTEMDRQQARIAAQADALSRERMAEEAEVFVAALRRDLVDASDFAR